MRLRTAIPMLACLGLCACEPRPGPVASPVPSLPPGPAPCAAPAAPAAPEAPAPAPATATPGTSSPAPPASELRAIATSSNTFGLALFFGRVLDPASK
ncbi:MAG: hypothetical protein HY744_10340 [Deltaproteobacteria bacterium]|nr:hypothetical protein [Deltaproteobacteria bacterium]